VLGFRFIYILHSEGVVVIIRPMSKEARSKRDEDALYAANVLNRNNAVKRIQIVN
jgi:hypothetical protein